MQLAIAKPANCPTQSDPRNDAQQLCGGVRGDTHRKIRSFRIDGERHIVGGAPVRVNRAGAPSLHRIGRGGNGRPAEGRRWPKALRVA